jgi:predicted HTH domain antitoxin
VSKIISTRMNEEEVEALNKIAEREHLDRAALVRKFVMEMLKSYRIREFAEYYRKGLVSLQEAATAAKVTLYEMMDHVGRERIMPPAETDAELRDDLERSKGILKALRH